MSKQPNRLNAVWDLSQHTDYISYFLSFTLIQRYSWCSQSNRFPMTRTTHVDFSRTTYTNSHCQTHRASYPVCRIETRDSGSVLHAGLIDKSIIHHILPRLLCQSRVATRLFPGYMSHARRNDVRCDVPRPPLFGIISTELGKVRRHRRSLTSRDFACTKLVVA